jgi:hypothetical protein
MQELVAREDQGRIAKSTTRTLGIPAEVCELD